MELALSLQSQYEENKKILGSPISALARMKGLCVDDVYDRLIPELAKKDIGNVLRYAEVGLRYASIVDRNRLREEVGIKFIVALDMIMNAVLTGLDDSEPWIKRKAMKMHGDLIDEMAEKQRFVETIVTERKIELLKESRENRARLESEIAAFEMQEQGLVVDAVIEESNNLPVEYGKYI